MYLLLFVVYVAAEIAVLAWLGSTVGALATVLIFLAVNVAGYLVLGAQGRRALRGLGRLRSGPLPPTGSPDKMLTDGALIGAGAGLVLLPGLITTVLGIVLLLPSRALLRPVVRAVAAPAPPAPTPPPGADNAWWWSTVRSSRTPSSGRAPSARWPRPRPRRHDPAGRGGRRNPRRGDRRDPAAAPPPVTGQTGQL